MYRGSGFQQQNYAMRQESYSSTNGYNNNIISWPMTTSPCITANPPQLLNHPMMVNGSNGYGYGYGQQQGDMSHFSQTGGNLNKFAASNGCGTYQTNATTVGGGGSGQQQGDMSHFSQTGGNLNKFTASNGCGTYQTSATAAGGGGSGQQQGDMSHFSQTGGQLNKFDASNRCGTYQTSATAVGGGGSGGYGTTYYDNINKTQEMGYGCNSHGFSGHLPPFGHVVSPFSHGGKINNSAVSDGFGTFQTNAIAVGGGGCGTYYDENFLNNFKAQEMGCGYDSGWGRNESQQYCPSGFSKGYQRVEYWASKGI